MLLFTLPLTFASPAEAPPEPPPAAAAEATSRSGRERVVAGFELGAGPAWVGRRPVASSDVALFLGFGVSRWLSPELLAGLSTFAENRLSLGMDFGTRIHPYRGLLLGAFFGFRALGPNPLASTAAAGWGGRASVGYEFRLGRRTRVGLGVALDIRTYPGAGLLQTSLPVIFRMRF
jgi:hypothetical protein